jgi:hypothetical protein
MLLPLLIPERRFPLAHRKEYTTRKSVSSPLESSNVLIVDSTAAVWSMVRPIYDLLLANSLPFHTHNTTTPDD